MVTTDRLEELKMEMESTVKEKMELLKEQDILAKKLEELDVLREKNKENFIEYLSIAFRRNGLLDEQERRYLHGKIEDLYRLQIEMNKQIIALNDNLEDTTSLKALYDEKRNLLQIHHEKEKNALKRQIEAFKGIIDDKQNIISDLDNDISSRKVELDKINQDIKDLSFKKKIKETIVNNWLIFPIILVLQIIITKFFLK